MTTIKSVPIFSHTIRFMIARLEIFSESNNIFKKDNVVDVRNTVIQYKSVRSYDL